MDTLEAMHGTFKSAEDLVLAETKKLAEKHLSKEALLAQIQKADDGMVENYRTCFVYEYPYKQEAGRKSKYSVSEIKHQSMVENYDRMEGAVEVPEFLLEEKESYVPEFARKMGLFGEDGSPKTGAVENHGDDAATVSGGSSASTYGVSRGALRGTAVHRVMECMDFKKLLEIDTKDKQTLRNYVEQELDRMLKDGLLPEEQLELVSLHKLMDFLESDTALRMAKADADGDLFREKPFVMDYDGVLVQGIIDVFWLEEGKIVLLDYKTDRVQKAEELIARYKTQLDLYAQALCRIFSTKEKRIEQTENLIYAFALDDTIRV